VGRPASAINFVRSASDSTFTISERRCAIDIPSRRGEGLVDAGKGGGVGRALGGFEWDMEPRLSLHIAKESSAMIGRKMAVIL